MLKSLKFILETLTLRIITYSNNNQNKLINVFRISGSFSIYFFETSAKWMTNINEAYGSIITEMVSEFASPNSNVILSSNGQIDGESKYGWNC